MNSTKFIKNYNEWFSFPLAFVLFFLAPNIYRYFDPTAGFYDAGVFHSLIFSVAAFSFFSGVSWVILKLKFPMLKKYLDDEAEDELIGINPHGAYKDQFGAITAFGIYYLNILFLIIILFTI